MTFACQASTLFGYCLLPLNVTAGSVIELSCSNGHRWEIDFLRLPDAVKVEAENEPRNKPPSGLEAYR